MSVQLLSQLDIWLRLLSLVILKVSKECISLFSRTTPLLTGGAIKKATQNLNSELLIVLNGDSFVKLDLEKISKFHREKGGRYYCVIGLYERRFKIRSFETFI